MVWAVQMASSSGPILEEPRVVFIAPISKPAPGSAGKTGTWRTQKPVVNLDKCTGCLICWLYCPEDTIIRLENDKVAIDYDYCKGCGICAHQCPFDAIEMVPEG
ncbi:MAG: 4Fe-4S binding protein [Desulfurococcales archaeon]|nr:4Fe-4S binding protein [Desulfurococcales archaeon]